MLLQIHDELILEVVPGEEAAAEKVLTEEMSQAAELRVAGRAGGLGRTWHEAGH